MGLLHEGMAQHGTAIFTHEQTKGKGQRNKQWHSVRDQNIAISFVLEPQGSGQGAQWLLSQAIAVAVYEFFNKKTAGDVSIKWPNDIYWRDRKAAGILIENIWQGSEWKMAIAGVGININQTDFGDLGKKAVSLRQITGQAHDPLVLAKELCIYIDKSFQQLINEPSTITTGYKRNLYRINETVRLKQGSRIFEATIKDVSPEGQLIVQHSIEERFSVGEIEWIG